MSPNELEMMTNSCVSRIEDHTAKLAKHEAMIKSIKEQASENSRKLSMTIFMIFLVIAEVPLTVMI